MAQPRTRPKFTYEDFLQLPDDGKRHEIIDGDHYVTPSPVAAHQRILGNLFYLIKSFLREHEQGEVFLSPFDVIFTNHDIVEPDLLYISNERRSVLTDKNVQGAPDVVVEILSPSTRSRDLGIKKSLYERCDVREYWIVEPEGETIEVLRREDQKLVHVANLGRATGDRLSTPLLPGLDIELREIFPD